MTNIPKALPSTRLAVYLVEKANPAKRPAAKAQRVRFSSISMNRFKAYRKSRLTRARNPSTWVVQVFTAKSGRVKVYPMVSQPACSEVPKPGNEP